MRKFYSLALICLLGLTMVQANQPKNSAAIKRKTITAGHFTGMAQRGGGVVCDTLQNFASTDTIVTYLDPDGGYISGQNSYGDIAKAEKFTGVAPNSNVNTVIMLFGAANAVNATDTFTVNIWDGTSGAPGTILASTNYTYQMAVDDVNAQNISVITFAGPAIVQSSFFAGIAFDYAAGDTVALTSSQDLSVVPATAWELFADGLTWVPFDDPDSWGLTVSHVILPVVCGTSGVKNVDFDSKFAVFPTIASEKVNVLIAPASENVSLRISDLSGSTVLSQSVNTTSEHSQSVDVSSLANGTYFISMTTGTAVSTRKFIVQR